MVAARLAIRRYLLPAPWTDPHLGIPSPLRHQLRLAVGSRRRECPESRPRCQQDDQAHCPWDRRLEDRIVLTRAIDRKKRNADLIYMSIPYAEGNGLEPEQPLHIYYIP